MTVIPEVHDALARAVSARSPAPRRRRWRRPVALLAGALIGTGVALAASGAWHPTLGDDHRGHPTVARTPIPGDQTAAIAVLRRPQSARDRSPQVRAVLRMLSPPEIGGIHTDGIRLLRRGRDGVTILVPVERVGLVDRRYRRALQRRVLCLMTSTRVAPVGLVAAQTCGDLHRLRTTGIVGSVSSPHGYLLSGLVPDGVATVVVRLRHHRYLRARVRDNLYQVDTGRELAPGWGTTWLDRRGRRIDHRRR